MKMLLRKTSSANRSRAPVLGGASFNSSRVVNKPSIYSERTSSIRYSLDSALAWHAIEVVSSLCQDLSSPPGTVRLRVTSWEEMHMYRWATAIATVATTAILLDLFEPALAVSDAQRLLLILLILPLFRSPLWLIGFLANERLAVA